MKSLRARSLRIVIASESEVPKGSLWDNLAQDKLRNLIRLRSLPRACYLRLLPQSSPLLSYDKRRRGDSFAMTDEGVLLLAMTVTPLSACICVNLRPI